MTDTMQAISQDELGGPEVLKRVTLSVPKPGMGEILVRVHAASVNPVDVMNRKSGAFVGKPPFVLGWDVSGTVEAIGPGVTIHGPGDEVFGICRSRTVTAHTQIGALLAGLAIGVERLPGLGARALHIRFGAAGKGRVEFLSRGRVHAPERAVAAANGLSGDEHLTCEEHLPFS